MFLLSACSKAPENGETATDAPKQDAEETAQPVQNGPDGTKAPKATDAPADTDLSEGMTCYSDAFDFYSGILTAIAYTAGEYIGIHNERLGGSADDPAYLDIVYMPFDSINMAMFSYVNDSTTEEELQENLEFYGFQDVHFEAVASGDYRLTFSDEQEDGTIQHYTNLMRYSNGSMRYEMLCDGMTVEFEEFISMGDGWFALQDMKERAVVLYRNGELISMYNTVLRSEFDFDSNALTSWSKSYDAGSDSIWGKLGLDRAWVDERSAAGEIYMTFDFADSILTISGFRMVGYGEEATFEPMETITISK